MYNPSFSEELTVTLDPLPPKPPSRLLSYVLLTPVVLVVLGVASIWGVGSYRLRKNPDYDQLPLVARAVGPVTEGCLFFYDYREEGAVARFLATLQQGNYQEAYRLWRPSTAYSYTDFVHDWGERGDVGKIRRYEILGSTPKGSSVVIVTVTINGAYPPLVLLVDRQTKGLAFSPF